MRVGSVLELFAGCGGTSTGLLAAGLDVRLGVDHNAAAIKAYNFNHSHVGSAGMVADIRSLRGSDLLQAARLSSPPDLVVGGPPCQPFSIIGKRRGLDDDRGDLVFEYARLITDLQPNGFIFENVANFARIGDGAVCAALCERLTKAGFAVTPLVVNAADFGVAQMRKRFVILGARGRSAPPPPRPTHGATAAPLLGIRPHRTCRDVLDDLPDVNAPESADYFNHEGTTHSAAMLRAFEQLPPGERDPKSHHDRLHPDRPSYTLRAGNGNFSPLRPIHYAYHRVVSVRESARIQSFPDWFGWPDDISRLHQYRQVGNAVPPTLAESLGRHLAKHLGLGLDPARFGAAADHSARIPSLSPEDREARRQRYIRGASIGRA